MFPQFSEKNYFLFFIIFKKNGGKKVWNSFYATEMKFFLCCLDNFSFLRGTFFTQISPKSKSYI